MTKTKEELNQLKEEYETLTTKLKELSEEELINVSGGGTSFNELAYGVALNSIEKALNGIQSSVSRRYSETYSEAIKCLNYAKEFLSNKDMNSLRRIMPNLKEKAFELSHVSSTLYLELKRIFDVLDSYLNNNH